MRYALDILAMLVVVPKVQLVLADTVDVLDETRSPVSTVGQYDSESLWTSQAKVTLSSVLKQNTSMFSSQEHYLLCSTDPFSQSRVSMCLVSAGMSIILGVAEGEVFVNDAEIQKSALQVSTQMLFYSDYFHDN